MDKTNINYDLLNQVPGYVYLQAEDTTNISCNLSLAKWFGFDRTEDLKGRRVYDIPLIENLAEDFDKQNTDIFKNNKQLKLLELTHNKDNDFFVCFTIKKVFFSNNGQKLGVIGQAFELDKHLLANFSKVISNASNTNKIKQGSYSIEKRLDKFNLSSRETECLFYLIRGKTAKEIAKHLFLSHRTIEKNLDSVKFKMGCHKKGQVIEKAIALGLMYTIPERLFMMEGM